MNLSNYSILPFYDNVDEQLCRRSYAYGEVYPLYVEKGKVPPFQFLVGTNNNSIVNAYLVNYTTGAEINITSSVNVIKKAYDGYDVFICFGGYMDVGMTVGRWYLRFQMSTDAIYSEVFTAVDDISPYLKVEWWDDEDLVMRDGRIVYEVASGIQFHNVAYFDSQLGMPEYVFEEEGETRDGMYFPEKMISEKTYRFAFLATEYVLDAMRFVRMSDNIRVSDRMGVMYSADTFLLTPKWQSPGMLAAVDAEFQTAAVAKKIGRNFTI